MITMTETAILDGIVAQLDIMVMTEGIIFINVDYLIVIDQVQTVFI